jgi:hypothetical protein
MVSVCSQNVDKILMNCGRHLPCAEVNRLFLSSGVLSLSGVSGSCHVLQSLTKSVYCNPRVLQWRTATVTMAC